MNYIDNSPRITWEGKFSMSQLRFYFKFGLTTYTMSSSGAVSRTSFSTIPPYNKAHFSEVMSIGV